MSVLQIDLSAVESAYFYKKIVTGKLFAYSISEKLVIMYIALK